jgi:hypothetical protein
MRFEAAPEKGEKTIDITGLVAFGFFGLRVTCSSLCASRRGFSGSLGLNNWAYAVGLLIEAKESSS